MALAMVGTCSLVQLRSKQHECRVDPLKEQSAATPDRSIARVMYTSTMRGDCDTALRRVDSIAEKADLRNKEMGVSGQLCYDVRQQRVWQVLEGNPSEVNKLWQTIENDPRHTVDEDTVSLQMVEDSIYQKKHGLRYISFADPRESAPVPPVDGKNLVQLKYTSILKETDGREREVMAEILPKAMAHNARHGITGWMLYNDRTLSVYQVLEGPRDKVEQLWEHIRKDPRHVVSADSVRRRTIPSREFADWHMALDQVECTAWNHQSY